MLLSSVGYGVWCSEKILIQAEPNAQSQVPNMAGTLTI